MHALRPNGVHGRFQVQAQRQVPVRGSRRANAHPCTVAIYIEVHRARGNARVGVGCGKQIHRFQPQFVAQTIRKNSARRQHLHGIYRQIAHRQRIRILPYRVSRLPVLHLARQRVQPIQR